MVRCFKVGVFLRKMVVFMDWLDKFQENTPHFIQEWLTRKLNFKIRITNTSVNYLVLFRQWYFRKFKSRSISHPLKFWIWHITWRDHKTTWQSHDVTAIEKWRTFQLWHMLLQHLFLNNYFKIKIFFWFLIFDYLKLILIYFVRQFYI